MTDSPTIEQAVQAFYDLSDEDTAKLKELNAKVQSHEGKWGVSKGGDKTPTGMIHMPWVQNDPLIGELIDFMANKNLLPIFNWTKWDEGSSLFVSEDPSKYDNVDIATALKLFCAATRKERFADGTLAWAFESGSFPRLINHLVELKEVQNA